MLTIYQIQQLILNVCLGSYLIASVHSQAIQIVTGREHTCAILFDGSLKCWGPGFGGRLGYGDQNARGDGPEQMGNNLSIVDLGTGRTAKQVAAGQFHTCAILDDDAVKCWGDGGLGKLGYENPFAVGDGPGEMGDNLSAVDLGTGRTVSQVAAGDLNTCAVLDDATLKCWGDATFGQTGYGSTLQRGSQPNQMGDNLPTVDLGTGRTAVQVSVGTAHTCARLDDASVKCWGAGFGGRLGYGDTLSRGGAPGQMGDNLTAVDLGTGRTAVDVSAGVTHTCAVLDDATVKCWGSGNQGELGYGEAADRGDAPGEMGDDLPAVDLGIGRTAVKVGTGIQFSCALLDNGSIKCWGSGGLGRLGLEDTATRGDGPGEMGDNLTSVNLGTGQTAAQFSVGGVHTCGLLGDSAVKCWGFGAFGALGYGDTSNRGDLPGTMGDSLPIVQLLVTGSPTVSPTASPTVQVNTIDPVLFAALATAGALLLIAMVVALYVAYKRYKRHRGILTKQVSA